MNVCWIEGHLHLFPYGLGKIHFEYINIRLMWTISALYVVLVLKYPVSLIPILRFWSVESGCSFFIKQNSIGIWI